MKYLGELLCGALLPICLFLVGGYFAVRLARHLFFSPRKSLAALKTGGHGGTSPVRAMAVALAGTLGVGNIAGVAAAIAVGGAGAVFWMWVAAFLAMPLKYAEIVLACCHRQYDMHGRAHGGAMYYIKESFGGRVGRVAAGLFAVLLLATALTLGSLLQSNAAAAALQTAFGVPPLAVGLLLAVAATALLLGGAARIERACAMLVPILCVGFTVASLAVLIRCRAAIPAAFSAICKGAFTPVAGVGGVLGVLTSRALRLGVARGLVSNEAGCGTAPIAHAAANAPSPAAQGLWGVLEVFVDTLLLCTLTALVILVSGVPTVGEGMALAIAAFGAVLGELAPPFIALSVTFFAFATVLCWAHYATEALRYFTRSSSASRVLIAAVGVATALGALFAPEVVWNITDLVLALMTLLNLATLFARRRLIVTETKHLFGE